MCAVVILWGKFSISEILTWVDKKMTTVAAIILCDVIDDDFINLQSFLVQDLGDQSDIYKSWDSEGAINLLFHKK